MAENATGRFSVSHETIRGWCRSRVRPCIADNSPYTWIGKALFLREILPAAASEPSSHPMAAVAEPQRALTIFNRGQHLRALQSAFRAVIPAAGAIANRQPCVVRNEDLAEAADMRGEPWVESNLGRPGGV